MPNPIQYRQTSLGKACYEKPLENRTRSHGVGACVTSMGAAQTCCSWETNVTLLSPTSFAFDAMKQSNLKRTPLCCHQTHLQKQKHFEAKATLHLLLLTKTILLSPALSDSQQKRALADKILGISSKCANYEPCFCKYLQIQKSCLQCMMTLSSLAPSAPKTPIRSEPPDATTGVQRHPLVEIRLLLENGQDHN